jgi:hypothetical protein
MSMVFSNGVLAKFNGNSPVDIATIQRFEAESHFDLPKEYAQFLQRANGGEGFVGQNAYVIFWRLEELPEMNRAYQVDEYAPGLFLFGSDGGGEAFAFDSRSAGVDIVSFTKYSKEPTTRIRG